MINTLELVNEFERLHIEGVDILPHIIVDRVP